MNLDFARIITLQRKERQISQKQAAADLGISQALLSHYEKGIRECGLNFLVKIADYYNVSKFSTQSFPSRHIPLDAAFISASFMEIIAFALSLAITFGILKSFWSFLGFAL